MKSLEDDRKHSTSRRTADILVLALDIDGVLTDGSFLLSAGGEEQKRVSLRDLDAVTKARRAGMHVLLLTGESGPMVQTIAKRVGVDSVLASAKDKLPALQNWLESAGLDVSAVCYVGDADRDAEVLRAAGLGLAPADASETARRSARITLRSRGGHAAVEEALSIIERLKQTGAYAGETADTSGSREFGEAILKEIEEGLEAKRRMAIESVGDLAAIAAVLLKTIAAGNKTLIFGNGGSAAAAQHVAGESVGRFSLESPPWPVIALTTDTSVLTAIANDWAYEEVFARQVVALGRPGDLAIGISTSGRSRNVLRGLDEARRRELSTVAFTGLDAGCLDSRADFLFRAPANSTPRIQELHLAAWHAICRVVERNLVQGRSVGA